MKGRKLGRRAFLKSTAALGAAAGGGAGADALVNDLNFSASLPALPDLQSPEDKIAEFQRPFDKQEAWRQRASAPMEGHEDLSVAEFITGFFEDTQTVMPQIKARHANDARIQDWFDTFVEIPEAIRKNLSEVVVGQVAQESKFDNNAYNRSSKALTMWQIVPDVYRIEANRDAQAMSNIEVSTQVAFYNYERIYTVLNNGVQLGDIDVKGLDFKAFRNHFGLSNRQWDNFLTLVMVNAYNTGERRMLEILHWFQAEYTRDDWAQLEDQTELGLFSLMADSARANRTQFERYDKHSSEYDFKSLAAQDSYNGGGLDYSQSGRALVGSAKGWVTDRLHDTGIPVGGGVATGLMAKNALSVPERYPKPKKKIKSRAKRVARDFARHSKNALEQSTLAGKAVVNGEASAPKRRNIPHQSMTRREAFKHMLGLTAASVVGVTGSRNRDRLLGGFEFDVPDLMSREFGAYSRAEVPAEVERFNSRGIFLSSSTQGFNETGLVDGPGRTALVSLRKDVWAAIEQMLEDLDLLDQTTSRNSEEAIIITGLAEDAGHSPRTHGHGPGYAVDFRNNRTNQTASRIASRLIKNTTVENAFTRSLHPEHRLLESGLVIGEKIFRYNSKYFLFGIQHAGKSYVCYFDAESSHRHMELIPWEDYNVDSQEEFIKNAKLPRSMKGIWREAVLDHIDESLEANDVLNFAWHRAIRDYLKQFID